MHPRFITQIVTDEITKRCGADLKLRELLLEHNGFEILINHATSRLNASDGPLRCALRSEIPDLVKSYLRDATCLYASVILKAYGKLFDCELVKKAKPYY